MSVSPPTLRERLRENAFREFCQDWAFDFAPRVKRKPSVWASEVRRIPAGTSPLSHGQDIPYDHARMPHLVEIMDAVDDPDIRRVVMWFAVREGKTLGVCANVIGRTVTDAPGNIYSVHPTDDNAEAFSKTDIEAMIKACLEGYFVEKKSRDTGRTIEMKQFKGGWIRIFSAQSLSKFHGTSVEVLLLHELDKLNPEAIFKAFGRTTGFANAITILESTGTLAAEIEPDTGKKIYRSNIEEAYDQGDQRKWFCPCRQCGFLQVVKYEQIKYPKGRPDKAYYLCEACDKDHTPAEWRKLAASGIWYPTAGLSEGDLREIEHSHRRARAVDPSVRSYWRNAFTSLLPHHSSAKSKLHEFVIEGEAAQRSVTAKMIWTQEKKAELWNPEAVGEVPPAWKPIWEAREDYGPFIPQPALYITAFVDCQLNRLEVEWDAWGDNEESWGMDHIVIEGAVRDAATWKALRQELKRRWEREDKAPMTLGMCLIDGGDYAEDVYAFTQDLARNPEPGLNGHVRASKGFGKHGHPIVDRTWRTVAKNLKGHHIGTWEAKDRIYERLRYERVANDTREGVMHYNKRFGEEYFQQLVAEQVVVTYEKGVEIRKYINPKKLRNEGLDLKVGNLAAFRLHPHNMEAIAQSLKEAAEQLKAPKQPPAPQRHDSGQNWATAGLKW